MTRTTIFGKRGMLFLLALGVGAAASFACGGDDEENKKPASSSGTSGTASTGTADAKAFYTSKVHQTLADSCKDCHQYGKSGAPVFLGGDAEASYVALEGFPGLIALPSLSPIIQKGVHSGPALNQTQSDLVTQWLKLEVTGRKLGSDPGAPKNLRAAFKAFGECMDYARWKELKIHTIAAIQTEGNTGACKSCHVIGTASVWLAGGTEQAQDEDDNAVTFLKFRQFPYVQRLVVGRVNDDGAFDGLEAAQRLINKGTEAQQLQANSHPRYSLTSEQVGGLATFVQETLAKVATGPCTGTSPDAGSYDAAVVAPPK
jgi:hypothetical protein